MKNESDRINRGSFFPR